METNKKNNLIFGKRLFLGFIKFYDSDKGFGFIVSNNYGMEQNPKFHSTTQNFYFNKSSVRGELSLSSLVVFQPTLHNEKLKAVNVRQYNKDSDSKIALCYFRNQNFINYTTKETIFHRYRSNEEVVHNHKISILLKSGISRYQIIDELCEQFREKGEKYVLFMINKLVYAAGGNNDYYKTLNSNYGNREKEADSLVSLFKILDDNTVSKIISLHPCFQNYLPVEFLKKNISLLKKEFGVPNLLLPIYNENELLKIIEQGLVFDNFYTEKQKEQLLRGINIQGNIEKLLLNCPEEHRETLWNKILQQMRNSICTQISSISNLKKSDKENFLLIYSKFIDVEQRKLIENLIKEDVINEVKEDCYSFTQKKNIDAYNVSTFINKYSDFYYNSKEDVQNAIINYIEKAYFCALESVISDLYNISNYWPGSEHYAKIYQTIQNCRIVKEHFSHKSNEVFKNGILSLYKKFIYAKDCPKSLIKDVQNYLTKEDYDFFIKSLADDLIKNDSLSRIYYFRNNIYSDIDCSLDYLLDHKSIDLICDFGSAFSTQEDKGLYLLDKLYGIALANTDDVGNFIIDNDPQGNRSNLIGYIIYIAYRNKTDKYRYYIDNLSFHDRILLSQSRMYGFDLATPDDIKKELQSNENYKINCPFLQRLRNVKTALIDIIYEESISNDIYIPDVIAWLRLYLSIKNREYYNDQSKVCEENRLIDSIKHIEEQNQINCLMVGIDTSRRVIAPSFQLLCQCDDFIKFIWHCELKTVGSEINLKIDNEYFSLLNESTIKIVELILGSRFINDVCSSSITFSNTHNYSNIYNILGHITMNVLYCTSLIASNLGYEVLDDLIIMKSPKLASYLTSAILMKVEDGMDAFWRVGDRGDIETTYTNAEITFEITPDPVIVELIKEVIPGIEQDNSLYKYSYHFKESEIASGYGRSYDYNNDINYKNGILTTLLKEMYLAYCKGLI